MTEEMESQNVAPVEAEPVQTELEEDLEQAPEPEKPDLEDEMFTAADEDETRPQSETRPKVSEASSEKDPVKTSSVEAVKASSTEHRAASSPPCEVSSTTLNTEEKLAKEPEKAVEKSCETNEKEKKIAAKKSASKTSNANVASTTATSRTEVIAETSETVEIIEEGEATQDEEEIDDVEPDAEAKKDANVQGEPVQESSSTSKADETPVESATETPSDKDEEQVISEKPSEETETEKMDIDDPLQTEEAPEESETNQADTNQEKPSEKESKEPEKAVEKSCETNEEEKKIAASSEEEIDDEEPELVIEEETQKEANVERLAASGISVTVIEKNRKASTDSVVSEAAKVSKESADVVSKTKDSIGLSSDISVTVVHKKKVDVGEVVKATTPKISVKKESELLQDPSGASKKDIVEVTRKQTAIRKPSIDVDINSQKVPPDPIVTISKVQNAAVASVPGGLGSNPQSLLRNSAPKSASPALAKSSNSNLAPNVSNAGTINSLASILGQPRMSTAPPLPRGFPPGSRPPLPPNVPRNGSPLMMAGAPYRPPGAGSPMGPMPNLHPRPFLGGPPAVTPPVTGPVSEQLNKVAGKLVDFMRGTLEELFKELSTQVSRLLSRIHSGKKCHFFVHS